MCLTLAESVNVDAPIYVFEFLNEFNIASEPIIWTPTDISLFPKRYNEFELDEPSDLELIVGQYSYKVTVNNSIIEEGRMVVELEEEINSIYL